MYRVFHAGEEKRERKLNELWLEFYALPAVGCDEAGKKVHFPFYLSLQLVPTSKSPPLSPSLYPDNVVHAKKSFSFPYST
jgi:hypothetical protein